MKLSDAPQIEHVSPTTLTPYPANARIHSKKQIHQIAASIQQFGFTNPILVDRSNTILAGHGRCEAAKLIGLSKIPIIRLEHLNESQIRAYVIADNRLAEKAGWDTDILKVELQHLSTLTLNFDLEITGFDTAELDLMIDGAVERKPDELDIVPPVQSKVVSRRGDVWFLGEHWLACNDALDPETYRNLLVGERVRLMFTDPPFNVRVDGHVGGLGAVKHREFAMASGEMTPAQFTSFLATFCAHAVAHSIDGAIHFICMDWRHINELMGATMPIYRELKNLCVWNKDNGGMGSFYRSKHELVFVFKVGSAPHINTIELGRSGRYRTNVWDYAGANSIRPGRAADLAMHPTVKPVALVMDAIRDCSRRNEIVLDPFVGSGTTIIAAHKTGRRARGIEIDPVYVDVAIRRWQNVTGARAVLQATGQTFADLEESRVADVDTVPANKKTHARAGKKARGL